MRKLCVSMLIAVLAAIPAGDALAKKKAAAHQHVEGSVALPQPYPADGTCVYRAHRSLAATAGDSSNGYFGYTFEVDPKTVNKNFKLEVADGAGMDISFYSELGDPSDPTTAPSNLAFETPGPGGESGKVPAGYPIAFVCMTEGQNASFTYTAGKGVK
jgi:hypothetical protein